MRTKTRLWASLGLTVFASAGTSVIWNGLPFIAKQQFGFSEAKNLSLYVLVGLVYVASAMCAGKWTRAVERYCSPRSLLGILLLIQAVVCSAPLFFQGEWVLWLAGGISGACSAWMWPIVESFLVAGRHGKEMRRAIGWWNIVWMVSVAATMFGMAPLMEHHASMVIVGLGVSFGLGALVLFAYPRKPALHEIDIAEREVPQSYEGLLSGARVLLPLSYSINGTLAPLLPFILTNLSVDTFWQTPAVASWMVARVGVTALMWRFGGWHDKWSILWIAILSMACGFVCIFTASGLLMLFSGLIIFGGGMGVAYYAGLYYAMAVGRADFGAGGTHEALIGAGYAVGPTAGLLAISSSNSGSVVTPTPLVSTVSCLLVAAGVALWVICKKAR
ncbi:MAG: MFS transporter [Phycisphaerales bacterium]|nr:MFS transporter [Phycisphaerales bacterium]